MGLTSYDAIHIRGILDPVIDVFNNHEILSDYKKPQGIKRSPAYFISTKSNSYLEGINMNISHKDPGAQFFGKHLKKVIVEEASFETQEVYNKRIDARHEIGCISEGQKILLSDYSSKNIEDIEIGDEIIGWDEENSCLKKSLVTNTIYQGEKDVIKVGGDNYGVWLTDDHEILCKSQGMGYRWVEAKRCLTTRMRNRVIPFVNDKTDFNRGLLLGIIESDGSKIKSVNKHSITYFFRIFQADEVDFIDNLLNNLNISFSKDKAKKSPWGKKKSFVWRIKKESSEFILNIYNEILKNKDVAYGFLVGFIIGDGYSDSRRGDFHISQSIKKERQVKLIDDTLNFLDIPYRKSYREQEGKRFKGTVKGFSWHFSKWYLPFYAEKCKKTEKWNNYIYNLEHKRIYLPLKNITLKGFKEKVPVYDLTTTTGNFIANGIIVHNCIERVSGMTNITRYSPAGKIYHDLTNRPWVMNLPQYVNPFWDEETKKKAIKKHGGENSLGFRIFVKGQVIEQGIAVFDMERIRPFYEEDRKLKHFEVTKENYKLFKDILVLQRPRNSELVFVCADIGETDPTEIIILNRVRDRDFYKLLYNITLHNLSHKEQVEIFRYIAKEVNTNFIGIDCTDGTGRAIYRELEEYFEKENLIYCSFNEKIPVEFDRDERDNIIFKSGNPLYIDEYVSEWSVKHLKDLLYNGKIRIPFNSYKFDIQINSVVASPSQSRIKYECVSEEDHLFQAFQVFSISEWMNAFNLIKPVNNKTFSKFGV
jgi:hypothetical protein